MLLRQRWAWLALAAFCVGAPQWIAYLFLEATPASAIATLVAFGLLGMLMAVGYDVRLGAERLRASSAFLLALNAIAVSAAGLFALSWLEERELGKVWLIAVALAHLAVGLAALRFRRSSHDFALLALAVG